MQAALAAAYSDIGAKVARATNIGQTHDERDLYWLIGQNVRQTSGAYGDFLCFAGCSQCCYNLPFVTGLEWERLYPYLTASGEDAQSRLLERTYHWFGHLLPRMVLAPGATMASLIELNQTLTAESTAAGHHCPLLVDDRCSVYEGRPMPCRAYGHFMQRVDDQRVSAYMCGDAQTHIATHYPKDALLPIYNKFGARLIDLQKPDPVLAFLPVWIASHGSTGVLQSHPDRHPDFRAAIATFCETGARLWPR
jgi:Fe-S-cluster containining protein